MATATTLSIVNKALILCGASTITSLSDDSANARAVSSIIEDARQGFLTESRWTFSTTRSTLSTISTATLAWLFQEEAYAYTRPSGALRIWDMSDTDALWREEGNIIISNTGGLGCRWAFDQTEYGLWRPKAITAFIDKLASDIAYIVINSASKGEALMTKYAGVSLPAAMAENSQTGFQIQVKDDAWTNAKYGGTGGDPSRSYS